MPLKVMLLTTSPPRLQVPQAAEQWEVERLHRAATQIQQAWRRHVARRADAAASAQAAALPQAVALLQGVARSATGPRRLDSMLAAVETVEHGDPAGALLSSGTSEGCRLCVGQRGNAIQFLLFSVGAACPAAHGSTVLRRAAFAPATPCCRQALAAGG